MTEMTKLSDENFKVALTKMLQQAIRNTLEINENTVSVKRNRRRRRRRRSSSS